MNTFKELGVKEAFIKGLEACEILKPTEIQKQAIPYLLQNNADFIGQAQTGTGKTAAYGLPILQKVNPKNPLPQALILCPTRELGLQISKQLFKFTKFSDKIFTEAVYGGTNIDQQIASLRRPTHIIVATPGRLIDLLERKAINLSEVKTIVLDEADEMLSMGFQKDIDTILATTEGQRNVWLFSATIPDSLKKIIRMYISPDANQVVINKEERVNKNIDHQFVECLDSMKDDILFHFLKHQGKERGLIFCKTKAMTQTLTKRLIAKNYPAEALHGDLTQTEREKVMRAFKNSKLQLLVATDMAARGLDIDNLNYVIHYQLPDQYENYTHRSGRVGRAGKKGISICFVDKYELKRIAEMSKELGVMFTKVK